MLSNRVIAWLRTIVPTLWAAAIVWLISLIPGLAPLSDTLTNLGVTLWVPVTLALYKWLLSKLEPHLPPWAARLFLGSANVPVYVDPPQKKTA